MQPDARRVVSVARLVALLLSLAMAPASRAAALRINGSTTVNLPVAEAAEVLRAERRLTIEVDTLGGSAGGISAVADGLADIGMASKPLASSDLARHPAVEFHAVRIGDDAVALVVSRDVWDAGVRALSRDQARGIYEGRIRNWREVGGPDRRIAYFNKEPGRGTWEAFAHWMYGDSKDAPPVSWPEVGGNEEARNKVASTRGALAPLSASWADGTRVFALGVRRDDGTVVEATVSEIAAGRYPMSRPLLLITRGQPEGDRKLFVDFMLGPRGQSLVRKHGYLPVETRAN